MKTIYNKFLKLTSGLAMLALAMGCLVSCEDELEIDPKSSYSSETFYKTVTHADLGVKGIYDVFTTKYTYGQLLSMNYPMDDDITYMRGTGFSNDNRKIAHYGSSPVTGFIERTWIELYKGVNYANLSIKKIQEMDLFTNGTDEEKAALNKYLGEAKFLRAFIYFDLVRLWGDVPLLTEPTESSSDFFVAKSNKSDVYDVIIQDLRDAKQLLPETFPETNDRANIGAVRGYLVRALLYRGGYALDQAGVMSRPDDYKTYYKEAAVEAKELMDLGMFGLLDSYEQVFRNLTSFIQDPTESLFEIATYNVANDQEDSGLIGTWNSPKTHADSPYGRANAYVNIRPDFKAEFAMEDVRRDVSVAEFEIDKNGNQKALKAGKPHFPGKWRRDLIEEPAQNPNYTNVNWCTLRYADVLLMFAEAVNEVRDELPAGISLQDGFDAINAVRTRAGLADLDNSLNYDDFFAAIKKERKLEMVAEGWRKYDLIRWNELGTQLRATQTVLEANYPKTTEGNNSVGYVAGVYFTDNKHELLPIPQRETDENVKLLQNPGY